MEEEILLRKAGDSNSMASAMVGRAMNTLLNARPKKLESSIVGLTDASRNSSGTLEESLRFLRKYVRAAVEEEHSLDEVLVPMIEHSLNSKESKHVNQAMILLNWLFQDEAFFTPLAKDLAGIISRREDHYIAFGWCRLVRFLVEYETKMGQFLKNGLRDNYQALLKILSASVRHLSIIVSSGSMLQDGFELPTRLSVAAADCILVLTEALTRKTMDSRISSDKGASRPNSSKKPMNILEENQAEQKNMSSAVSNNIDGALLLWRQLDQLIMLVKKLQSWSLKSRPLHAKGLQQVLKWLHEVQNNYVCAQDEAGSQFQATGALLLSSCWRHYSMLSLLEDSRFHQRCDELVEQYLSGIQFYSEGNAKDHIEDRESSIETRKFFLNCLALLLGRLDQKRLEDTTSVYGLRMSQALLSQLHCADEDVIDGALCIFRSAIFKITGSNLSDPREIETLLPPLLGFLDERDGAARAVIVLIAEYCSISKDTWCLQEVLKRLASGDTPQRKNAFDVISELVRITSNSMTGASGSFWEDIANQLLECLRDEEGSIRAQATQLLAFIDPSLVLPTLVRSICSVDETEKSASSNAFVEILKQNSQQFDVVNIVLDSLSNLGRTWIHPQDSRDMEEVASKFNSDEVFKLLPEWSKTVQDWKVLVGPLVDKMLSEPSNATMIKFLSSIHEYLADTADLVLGRLLLRAQEQEEISKSICAGGGSKAHEYHRSDRMNNIVFDRLCPLLIIKILPLSIFNDLSCMTMYGQTLKHWIVHGTNTFDFSNYECVATLLFNRAFCRFEYEDVRKLAAELCGRIHPQVLFPVVVSQLQHAADKKDVLNMKGCLFSICTSLAIRGWESASHVDIFKFIRILQVVLLWPSVDGDEVSKAQHGCIDCLALMICAELQAPKPIRYSMSDKSLLVTQNASVAQRSQCPILGSSVLALVFDNLATDEVEPGLSGGLVEDAPSKTSIPISFRLCMANVLISAYQKISESGKKTFARKSIPRLINLTKSIKDATIRAACIQVLFSAAYHLKSLIVPYAHDLLRISIESLKRESEQERMAGAKLLASLMANEDVVMESISAWLLEARPILLKLSTSDPSPQLRQICQKLLVCLTSQ